MNNSNCICPCQSHRQEKKNYVDCCQPYHLSKFAPKTAEQLMRSRYSAYVLHNIAYVVSTTLPAQQKQLEVHVIADWSKQTHWTGLEIIKHIPKVDKRHAKVEFKAMFKVSDGVQFHHELSAFVQIKDNSDGSKTWYFIDPTVHLDITNKHPCICGSGEKFKRCCGIYL